MAILGLENFRTAVDVREGFPNFANNPEAFQSQYCHDEAEAKSMISWTGIGEHSQSVFAGKGKPASGGKGKGKGKRAGLWWQGEEAAEPSDNTVVKRDPNDPDKHWRRDARICGLADLFEKFGDMWTAKEIFEYYEGLHVFAHKRERGKSAPERRAAANQRYRESGRYGHGSSRRGGMWWQ